MRRRRCCDGGVAVVESVVFFIVAVVDLLLLCLNHSLPLYFHGDFWFFYLSLSLEARRRLAVRGFFPFSLTRVNLQQTGLIDESRRLFW